MKVVAEKKQVVGYREKIEAVINQVRSKHSTRLAERSEEIGRVEMDQFATGLERQLGVIGTYPDRRRARIKSTVEELKRHAHVPDFIVEDVAEAFAEEERLQSEVHKEQPGPEDLLVLATVLRSHQSLPGVFLTRDEPLRELAVKRRIECPDPEKFANGS